MGADGPHVGRIQIELHHRLQRYLIQKQPVRVVDGDFPAQLRQHEAAKRYGILAGEKESTATEGVQRGQQTGRFGSFQFPDGVFIIKVAVVEALQCVQTGLHHDVYAAPLLLDPQRQRGQTLSQGVTAHLAPRLI